LQPPAGTVECQAELEALGYDEGDAGHDNERGDRLHVILDGLALLRRLADTERPWEDYGH